MIWLAFPAFVFLTVRLAVVLVNIFSRPYLKEGIPERKPGVSVLIPARNEEQNLPELLDGLLKQDYPLLEVLVYNDDSTDATRSVVEKYAEGNPQISLLEGGQLPEGWSGKNHACHQLSLVARGDYFLFLDADVKVRSDLVGKSIRCMLHRDLTLFSMFPKQLMKSFGELLTVPIMNWILLSLLALRLIRLSHYPSLSAANGQFMLFRAREYRQHRFHELVKEINVEDIHIIRKVKKMGYLAQTLLSRGEVSCRMYGSYKEGIFGFTRSMFAFFGGSGIALFLFTLFSTFGLGFVWLGMSFDWAMIYLFLSLLTRILILIMSYQPVIISLFLFPLMQVSFVWIVLQAFRMRRRGTNTWKGRIIKFRGI
jgi:chlorobactene glucosyltransferase